MKRIESSPSTHITTAEIEQLVHGPRSIDPERAVRYDTSRDGFIAAGSMLHEFTTIETTPTQKRQLRHLYDESLQQFAAHLLTEDEALNCNILPEPRPETEPPVRASLRDLYALIATYDLLPHEQQLQEVIDTVLADAPDSLTVSLLSQAYAQARQSDGQQKAMQLYEQANNAYMRWVLHK